MIWVARGDSVRPFGWVLKKAFDSRRKSMRIKPFLIACSLLALTTRAFAQTEITRFEEIIKDIPVIKLIRILKTPSPDDRKEYHLQNLDNLILEESLRAPSFRRFPSYPRLDFLGLKSRPGAFGPVADPGIEEIVGTSPEVHDSKGRVLSKESRRWSWSVPPEIQHSYEIFDNSSGYAAAAAVVLLPVATSDTNPVLVYFDRRTGFKWSQRIPLQDCFKQLGIDETKMEFRSNSDAWTSMTQDSTRIFVQLTLRSKEHFLFIYDNGGALLKTYVFPGLFRIFLSGSSNAFYIDTGIKRKLKSPKDGKIIEEYFREFVFMDGDGNPKARFEPFNNKPYLGPECSFDDSHAAMVINPESEGYALFELPR